MTTLIANNILEQLNTLVLTVNPSGNIEYVSPSVKQLLGYEPNTLLGEGWWELTRTNQYDRLANKSEILSLLNSKNKSGSWSFERALTASNGEIHWVLWNVSLNHDKTLIGVGQDITLRKKVELQLLEKNRQLQVKNSEIIESIQYAKRIQDAVIKDPSKLKTHFSDAFILYKPRDVVSGDFYWYHKKGNKIYVAAVDCTGHGVPGAIMSVIASGLIKDVVVKHGLEDPGEILHAIDKERNLVLSKDDGTITSSDGMDISFAVIDFNNNTLAFAGAYRPLIVVRDGKILEFRGSKYPIGFFEEVNKNFETNYIPLQNDDKVYLFTDGYVDQFGGEKNKKLNRQRFYELLLNSHTMDIEEQRLFLDYALNNWKQDEPQTDDILVIGIKI